MQLLSNSEIDNLCKRAANLPHVWPYETPEPDEILDFYMIDLFTNLLTTGLRYSELVDPTLWTLIDAVTYQVNTLKGSNTREIKRWTITTYLDIQLDAGIDPYPMCRYSTTVRYFKKVMYPLNIHFNPSGLSTHIFRHNLCKKLSDQGKTASEISAIIGEADNQNTLSYINSSIYIN